MTLSRKYFFSTYFFLLLQQKNILTRKLRLYDTNESRIWILRTFKSNISNVLVFFLVKAMEMIDDRKFEKTSANYFRRNEQLTNSCNTSAFCKRVFLLKHLSRPILLQTKK